jgi:hypothetical protein
MHVLPLGYRAYLDGKPNVTLQDPSTGERKGFSVTPDYFELLIAIDPTVTITNEDARLRQLSDLGILAILPDDATLEDLTYVPIARSTISLQEVLEDGYRFQFGEGKSFVTSEFGGRFFLLLDSIRTLGEIVQTVKENALDDEENAASIAENERSGNGFDEFLMREAYAFAKTLIDSGAATFERQQQFHAADPHPRAHSHQLPGDNYIGSLHTGVSFTHQKF